MIHWDAERDEHARRKEESEAFVAICLLGIVAILELVAVAQMVEAIAGLLP